MSVQTMEQEKNEPAKPQEWTSINLRIKGILTPADMVNLLGDVQEHVVSFSTTNEYGW